MKKIAYLILFICIIGAGYFVYDTYKIIRAANKDIEDTQESISEEDVPEISVDLKYNRYSINKNLPYSLLSLEEDEAKLYLYSSEVSCSDEVALDISNPDLHLILDLSDFVSSVDDASVTSARIIKHDLAGHDYEISSVPAISNSLSYEEDNGALSGDMKLEWSDRSAEGKFNAIICE